MGNTSNTHLKEKPMKPPTLQEAIDTAGSPMGLVWKPNAPAWKVPVIEPEYAGWRQEQAAWRDGVAISDLSHHMWDLWIEGPDALKLLMDYSANNYDNFVIGQAKQFVPVTAKGHLVTDGIIMRDSEERYTLAGFRHRKAGSAITAQRAAMTQSSASIRIRGCARKAILSCSAISCRGQMRWR